MSPELSIYSALSLRTWSQSTRCSQTGYLERNVRVGLSTAQTDGTRRQACSDGAGPGGGRAQSRVLLPSTTYLPTICGLGSDRWRGDVLGQRFLRRMVPSERSLIWEMEVAELLCGLNSVGLKLTKA